MPQSPLSRYEQLIEQCAISADDGQYAVIRQLNTLYDALVDRIAQNEATDNASIISRFVRRFNQENMTNPHPKGIYLWGGVGRGKSMLMDLFYHCLPGGRKHRVHFHQFMQDVHRDIHRERQQNTHDPLGKIAHRIAEHYSVICFDELQVHDITDAMLLTRLFTVLFDAGTIIIFTSNRPPSDLYLHGLQRDQFLPFIALANTQMHVIEIATETDYRQNRIASMQQRYYTPLHAESANALSAQFAQMINHALPKEHHITVGTRDLIVPKAYGDVAWLTFSDVCGQALGSHDYAELAALYRTIFIADIPIMSKAEHNEAKRFVTLIDILYEAGTLLCCSAAAAPESLYEKGEGAFEFERTESRLREMMSDEYAQAHGDHIENSTADAQDDIAS